MILVVGATGLLGSEICSRLRGRGLPVRALVRSASVSKAGRLRELGVDICAGDLRVRADEERACESVAAVISTATAMGSKDKTLTLRAIDREAQLQLVDVAKRSGVGQYVYISASPNLTNAAPLIRYKREVEAAVRSSGMRWTILKASVFMEVWLGPILGWDIPAGKATIFGAGTAPLAWVSVSDVAEYAVRALEDARLQNVDVPIGGPAALSPNQVVEIFERVTGRSFSVKRVPRLLLRTLRPIAELFNEQIASGMGMGGDTASGDVIDSPIQRGIGVQLTTVEEYATRVASSHIIA